MENLKARNRNHHRHPRQFYLISLLTAFLLIGSVAFVGTRFATTTILTESEHTIAIRFTSLLPLRTDLPAQVQVSSMDPRQEITYELKRQSPHEIHLEIVEHKVPVGYPITVSVRCPTLIPTLQWSVNKTITRRVQPRILSFPEKIGTTQPILIRFNTPIDDTSLRQNLTASFDYHLRPNEVDVDGQVFTDIATWLLIPVKPLAHNHTYQVEITESLRSTSRIPLGQKYTQQLTTVTPLTLKVIQPANGAKNVPISTAIQVQSNRKPVQYKMTVNGLPQPVVMDSDNVTFHSTRLFLPDTEYQIELTVEDEYGETASQMVHFTTATMGEQMWVEVSLWSPNQVRVYQGKTLIREMIASAGKAETPTPTGWYRINGRGYAFFSYKYQEGAYYWVRFLGNYLFHSIPFDPNRNIKQSEAEKLGQPASHGCVRLSLENAKWFYDNVPDGTLVIIHGPPQSLSSIASNIDETRVFLYNDEELRRFLEGVN